MLIKEEFPQAFFHSAVTSASPGRTDSRRAPSAEQFMAAAILRSNWPGQSQTATVPFVITSPFALASGRAQVGDSMVFLHLLHPPFFRASRAFMGVSALLGGVRIPKTIRVIAMLFRKGLALLNREPTRVNLKQLDYFLRRLVLFLSQRFLVS